MFLLSTTTLTNKASDLSYFFSEELSEIKMDISTAYPKEAGIDKYQRKASLIKKDKIILKDTFSFVDETATNSVILSFMVYEPPYLHSIVEFVSIKIDSLGCMKIKGGTLQSIEEIPITDSRLQTAWNHPIYRILVRANVPEVEIHIS